jgi:putative transcriptional regulator
MAKFTLDPNRAPELPADLAARQEAMTEDQIQAGAEADQDNPPLTAEELGKMEIARLLKLARTQLCMSQLKFAQTFGFTTGRVRDLEQGRQKHEDGALRAYLTTIARDPFAVMRALNVQELDAAPSKDVLERETARTMDLVRVALSAVSDRWAFTPTACENLGLLRDPLRLRSQDGLFSSWLVRGEVPGRATVEPSAVLRRQR